MNKNSIYTWTVVVWNDGTTTTSGHVVVAQTIGHALSLMIATGVKVQKIISITRDNVVRSVQAEAVTDDPAALIEVVMHAMEQAS